MSDSQKEQKGIIDRITDFGKELAEGFAGKQENASHNEPFQPHTEFKDDREVKKIYSQYVRDRIPERDVPVEYTKPYRGPEDSSSSEYAHDAQEKVRENTKEMTEDPLQNKDEVVREKENQNKDSPKVREFGFDVDYWDKNKDKKSPYPVNTRRNDSESWTQS